MTFQPNVNLGASIPFGPTKELNIGFFTDLSSVSAADIAQQGSDRVHMFGGSMTLGLLGKQSRVWVGTSGEVGHTTTRVPGQGFNYQEVGALPMGVLPTDGDATLVRWTLVGILGSNYSFLGVGPQGLQRAVKSSPVSSSAVGRLRARRRRRAEPPPRGRARSRR